MPLTNPTYGDKPQINRGFEGEGKRLFYSERAISLLMNKTVQEGYGLLDMGTAMAAPTVSGELVPYPPVAFSGEDFSDPKFSAYIPLILDGTVDAWFYCSNADAAKVRVGQAMGLAFYNTGYTYVDLGDVVSITLNSGVNGRAKIVVTNAPTTNATVARQAAAYVKTDSSSPYAKCSCIADKGVDTGIGQNAKGGLTSVVISNAILYRYMCQNLDSDAITDLSASTDGQFLILK